NSGQLRSLLVGIIFLSILGLSNQASAQTKFGITGGLNVSSHLNAFNHTSDDIKLSLDPKIKSGYQGGLILRQNITKAFRMQIEPAVILLGAKYDETFTLRGSQLQTESRTELLYVQLPLLFQ